MSIVRLPLASPSFAALPSRPELRAQSVAFALLDGPRISFAGKADPLRLQRAVVSTRKLGARRCGGAVCHAVPVNAETLQWVSAVSAAALMLVKGTAIHKSFLVPLFALQAPASVVSWIKGEYGTWTAFLALLVRLFYFFPGELDLPFFAMLLVIVAPSQTMNIRGTQAGGILSLAIAAFLAFQHFSGIGNLKRAFDQGSIVATIAIISITVVTFLLLL